MATWSITHKEPSTAPDASIDSSTGAATFPANQSTTTDNVYTIQYDNGNGCTETTTYTVKKCIPAQECRVVLSSADGNFPCEEGVYNNWLFNYEYYENGTLVDDGQTEGELHLERGIDVERTISYGDVEASITTDIDDKYSDCTWEGTFTQDGCGSGPSDPHYFVVKLKFMNYTTTSFKEDGCFEGMTSGTVMERRNKICIQSLKIDGVDYTSTASVSLLVNAADGIDGSGNFLFGGERTISSGEVCKSQILDYNGFYFCNPPSFSPAFELLPDYSFKVSDEISITAGGITSTSNDSLSISFEETSQDC